MVQNIQKFTCSNGILVINIYFLTNTPKIRFYGYNIIVKTLKNQPYLQIH